MPDNSLATRHVTSKGWAWTVIAIALAVFAALTAVASGVTNESSAPAMLPPSSESYKVREATKKFPGGDDQIGRAHV